MIYSNHSKVYVRSTIYCVKCFNPHYPSKKSLTQELCRPGNASKKEPKKVSLYKFVLQSHASEINQQSFQYISHYRSLCPCSKPSLPHWFPRGVGKLWQCEITGLCFCTAHLIKPDFNRWTFAINLVH